MNTKAQTDKKKDVVSSVKAKANAKPVKKEAVKKVVAPEVILSKIKTAKIANISLHTETKLTLAGIRKDDPEHMKVAEAECQTHTMSPHKGKVYCHHCPVKMQEKKCTAEARKKVVMIHKVQKDLEMKKLERFFARAFAIGAITAAEALIVVNWMMERKGKEKLKVLPY